MTSNQILWDKYDNIVNVVSFKHDTANISKFILCLMTFKQEKFLSITYSNDELTICYDATIDIPIDNLYEDSNKLYKEEYLLYKSMNTGSLIEEAGLVERIASIFSDQQIPIMFITSFNNDYVFVPKEYQEKADKLLNI
ncbi:CASTOR ACT domain-containing protein [Fadolivirus algeromassiliense]|jgi:hypothetical protein|uniref:CASTOR ACT domain-containing protein n=1 Tax=Fadolivirus FV1/VV64 TaxID=3070911 RepID=A0A7D3URG9_9VIRU|nr:CASTOR ACT domain-containing protein [Fadolivirus algeromassiliense]QKF94653.1 CASTOR ACT domain-containing protein [Fadolivirus FV1/VV64]